MAISDRIQAMYTHISDIYDSVELTGVDTTDIDKNLVNVPNTLKEGYIDIINNGTDTLYNNFPKVSGEGTSLTLNNTYQAPMRNNLKGNTSQTGTPTPSSPIPVNVVSGDNTINVIGKNLFGGFEFSRSSASVTFTTHKDGSITMSGTSTATTYSLGTSDIANYKKTLVAGTYTLSGGTSSINLVVSNSSGTNLCNTNGANSVTFTLNSDTDIVVRANVPKGTVTNTTVYPMLSTSGGDYTPYQTTDTYSINLGTLEMCKIGTYQDQFKKATGKNLAPINLESETYNSLQITNNNNGTFTLLGNPTGSFGRDIATNLTLKAGTYTISANAMPSGLYIALDNEADTQLSNGTLSKTFTLASDTTYTSLGIWFTKNKDYDVTIKLQIEKSSSATEWQPMNGWYLHKEVGKVVLNGSEEWSTATSAMPFRTIISGANMSAGNPNMPIMKSNIYTPVEWDNDNKPDYSISCTSSVVNRLCLRNVDFTTTQQLKSSLANNNMILYYALSTPTSEGIPSNLINQLEEFYQAQSKNNQTNISQINNDLPFIVSASALKKG